MMLSFKKISPYLLIFVLACTVFSLFLGNVHLFDWDEANFAEAAREMLLTKNYMQVQIDFQAFWEKPPLFIWLQALSMSVWGINEFAARFPNAVIGALTLCSLFFIGQKIANKKMAWLWIIIFAGSWLPHFYFKTAIIDPLFNLLIFLAFFQIHLAFSMNKIRHYLWSGLFLGLAVLTKGPVAILLSGISLLVYLIVYKQWRQLRWDGLVYLSLIALLTIFTWFGVDIIQNGWWFTETFLTYQVRLLTTSDAGHGGPFFYHFIVLLMGCFPASVLLFQYTKNKQARELEFKDFDLDFGKWMQMLFWTTLIVFSIVKTKIIHYSSLCYFPLTYFAARELYMILYQQKPWKKVALILLGGLGFLLALSFILVPVVGQNIDWIQSITADQFAVANMDAKVYWSYFEMIYGVLALLILVWVILQIRKKQDMAMVILFLLNIILIEGVVQHFTPKIEEISQGAAIRFYESVQGENAIVYPSHFKSYAYLFYSKKDAPKVGESLATFDAVLRGEVNKDLYFVIKNIAQTPFLESYPQAVLIKEENGYLLYQIP